MKILITGNKGFIGSHLEDRLKDLGHHVIGFDRRDRKWNVLPDVDVVFHMAATNGTLGFYEKPYEVQHNDTQITLDVIDRYKMDDTRIVFASSSELYNGSYRKGLIDIPFKENSPVCFDDYLENPRTSYSIPKLFGESLLSNAHDQYSTDYLILRYFNVFGPRQKDHFISDFIERALDGKYVIYGNDLRSFIYIDDAIDITIDLGLSNDNEWNVYNIGTTMMFEPLFVAKEILDILGIDAKVEDTAFSMEGSPKNRLPDIERIHDEIMKHGNTSLRKGLEKTVEWHVKRRLK